MNWKAKTENKKPFKKEGFVKINFTKSSLLNVVYYYEPSFFLTFIKSVHLFVFSALFVAAVCDVISGPG